MYTLFIDTHYKDIKVYLFKDDTLLNKQIQSNVKNTSVETMPLVVKTLIESKVNKTNLNKIAVCTGPGSFTGTRIGVTIAKTLAYSLNIEIVTLTSLDLIGLNLEKRSYVASLEKNGAFVCLYDKNIVQDIFYLKNSEYIDFKNKNKVVENIELDDVKLINFINNLKSVNYHEVKPLYVKAIEALK